MLAPFDSHPLPQESSNTQQAEQVVLDTAGESQRAPQAALWAPDQTCGTCPTCIVGRKRSLSAVPCAFGGSSSSLSSAEAGLPPAKLPHRMRPPHASSSSDSSMELAGGCEGIMQSSEAHSSSIRMSPWRWSEAWATREQPAPAAMRELASFPLPGSASHVLCHRDIVSGLQFSMDGQHILSVGISKQIRLYGLPDLRSTAAGSQLHLEEPLAVRRMPSKLSSAAWDPLREGIVTVGDYDGVVSQVDISNGHVVQDADEHAGRRVWSVCYSSLRPRLLLSTSDEGCARIWSGPGLDCSAGILRPPGGTPVCGGEFCFEDEHLVALASADHSAYLYDLRRQDVPLEVLSGHCRPVSYVRFLSRSRVVTASTDASLACWDLRSVAPASGKGSCSAVTPLGPAGPVFSQEQQLHGLKQPWRRFHGHANHKNFVGLAVDAQQGLLACGSESNSVHVYNTHWSQPLASYHCDCSWLAAPTATLQQSLQQESSPAFVSAVCWHPSPSQFGPVLAVAESSGVLHVLQLAALAAKATPD